MNIAILIPGFSDGERDWCIPVYLNLVRRLAERHSVTVFALRYPARRDTYSVHGAKVIAVGGRHDIAGMGRLRLWATAFNLLARAHRQTRFDVLHAIWADETGFLANLAAKALRVPSVVSLAGGELAVLPEIGYGLQTSRFSRWIVRQALMGADRVAAPSLALSERAARLVDPSHLLISPLGVDTKLFSPGPKPRLSGPIRLLAVGSLLPVKNHAALLRVLSQLPNAELTIVGDGPLRLALENLADKLGVANRVRIQSAVAHDALPEVYAQADLHILTSQHEAFGMVVLEAAACGLPTIGYSVGVLPELASGGAGIAVPSGDEGALTTALRDLSADPSHIEQMGQAARNLVAERYSLDAMTDGIQRVYRSAIAATTSEQPR